jgi:hypothetical protein
LSEIAKKRERKKNCFKNEANFFLSAQHILVFLLCNMPNNIAKWSQQRQQHQQQQQQQQQQQRIFRRKEESGDIVMPP